MDKTREKLIEILRQTRYEYRRYIAMKDYEKRIAKTDEEFLAIDDSIVGEIPFCADHLIANGVTVQEWIPVTEKLPKLFVHVLVIRNGEISIDYHEEDGWFSCDFNGKRVTHWMPLPELPKGE